MELHNRLKFYMFLKHIIGDAAEEWIEVNSLRSPIKLTCSQQRILGVYSFSKSPAWKRALQSRNFCQSFRDLAYTWIDNRIVIELFIQSGKCKSTR